MKRALLAVLLLDACSAGQPTERYGFVARLGNDTVSVESVTRRGNTVTSDEVDRFPRVRQRHAEITLGPDGAIQRLVMDIRTPSEPPAQRERHVVADVTKDSVKITKRDSAGVKTIGFATGGAPVVAHLEQMYSLYEIYFAAALARATGVKQGLGETVRFRQFYIDREFDRFPLGNGTVWLMPDGKAEIAHDWLAGTGVATIDSSHRMLHYSGARTTYKMEVDRLADAPDVQAIGERFAAAETKAGGVKSMSMRDTTRVSIGGNTFNVDYGRPLVRGRQVLGNLVPYDSVWRTGANAATQFTTSAPITLAGIKLAKGTYTLWTSPHKNGTELIVNKQTGQWGTGYDGSFDLGKAAMATETLASPVEKFTISIDSTDARRGTLAMSWGPFRWTAPIVVQ
ncbi:MAG: DUF2911 domain-containing protein [bacterium]